MRKSNSTPRQIWRTGRFEDNQSSKLDYPFLREEVGSVLRDTLFSLIRVHINIVHDYRPKANGSLHVGQKQGCVGRVLRCLFIMPYWFCPLGKRFEALVLALTLLINMVEHCEENRQSLMDSMAAQKELDSFCVKVS